MRIKNIFSIIIGLFLILLVYINIRWYQSSYLQTFLLYDYNNNKYLVPYEEYMTLNDKFPNLTHTALPIKYMKARYLLELDSIETAKKLLYESMEVNPYIMANHEMLAKIYIKEQNYDSAYKY